MTPILPSGYFSRSANQERCHSALKGHKVCWSMVAAAPQRQRMRIHREPGASTVAGSPAPAQMTEMSARRLSLLFGPQMNTLLLFL